MESYKKSYRLTIFLIKYAFSAHLHFASENVSLAREFAIHICNEIYIICDDESICNWGICFVSLSVYVIYCIHILIELNHW